MTRPELQAPPDIFYNESEACKYTTSSRIVQIQAIISERALELLNLPNDGVPRLLLDIGCGSGLSGETLTEDGHHWIGYDISESMLNVALEREVDGDLMLADMGQGLGLQPGVIDGAISISAIQWLCYADKSSQEPRLRLKAFFGSLYRCLSHGARAVLQLYAENMDQSKEGLSCGSFSTQTALPKGKGENGEMCSDSDEDETVGVYDRTRPKKRLKVTKKGKGREWVIKKKEQMRKKGRTVPPNTKYTNRKRKARF